MKISFETYEKWWHKNYQKNNPNFRNTIYMDGQFDELPYLQWEEMEEIDKEARTEGSSQNPIQHHPV